MRLTNFLFCAMLLTSSLAAFGSSPDKAPPENGVWTGSIGNSKVMACFERDDNPAHTNLSAYFYLRYSKSISLVPDPGNTTIWIEGNITNPTGIWTIKVDGDRITGNWSNYEKTRKLPIALNRFKSISSHRSDCGPEFGVFDPVVYTKVLSEKIAFGGEHAVNGRRYHVLSVLDDAVKSIALVGKGETITALNTLLANELRTSMSAYYKCPTNSERYSEKSGKNERPDYQSSIEPIFWNDQWISFVARTSGDCGGAHPFSDYLYITWNLGTGKEINLWEWISDSKKDRSSPKYDRYYFNYFAPERLNKLITTKATKQRLAFNPKEASEENNCLDVIQSNSEYQIRLSKSGLVFTQVFPHVAQACNDDIEISYEQLMPFLTKKGKDAVTAILRSGP